VIIGGRNDVVTVASPPAPPNRSARLDAAFAREEYLGLRLAAIVRTVGILVILVWITIENFFPEVLYFYAFVAVFGLLGVAPLWLQQKGRYRRWMRYLFPLLDVALLTVAVAVPNPLERTLLPPQQLLRFGNELYLFVFIAAAVFTYSPAVVLWTGVCAALVWSMATLVIASQPGTVGFISSATWHAMSDAERYQLLIDPHRVHVGLWGRQVVLFLLTAVALAVFVRRARRLVAQQAEAERERANLSRYFSANMVDELAQSDQPLGPTRQQDVAVLFADIVGFTGTAERLSPQAVIELLRGYHGRMERLVFDHAGTVDKYIGDELMATFGTPRAGPADATNALRCARAMVDAMREWNRERVRRGEPVLRVGIGLHQGPVVLGDIGGETRLEYAVVGDTVNVASRLERLTRQQGAEIIASDALVAAVRQQAAADCDALLAGLTAGPAQTLRGRVAPMPIWQFGQSASP
jgi:adenylate cyclase